MVQTVTVTSKGQMQIPAKMRRKMGLKLNSKVQVTLQNKKLTVELQTSNIFKLGGIAHNPRVSSKLNLTKIRDFIDYSQL